MKHLKPISVPHPASDLNSIYWIIVNFVNAGAAILGIFAQIFQTVSYNIHENKEV